MGSTVAYQERTAQIEAHNDAERQRLARFLQQHGGLCVVGKLNLSRDDPHPSLWALGRFFDPNTEANAQIPNYSISFAVPRHCDMLRHFISQRRYGSTPWTSAEDRAQLHAILGRVRELGGIVFYWQ